MSQIYKRLTSSGPIPGNIPTQFDARNQGVSSGISIPVGNIEIFNSTNNGLTFSVVGNQINFTINETAIAYRLLTGPIVYVVDSISPDYYLSCDCSGGAVIIQLPDSPTLYRQFIIKNRGNSTAINTVRITTVSGLVLIDNQTLYSFSDNWESSELLFNGTFYEIF